MTTRRLIALLGLSAGVYALAIRPRMIQWGASDEEVHGRHSSDHRPAGKGSNVCLQDLTADPCPPRVCII